MFPCLKLPWFSNQGVNYEINISWTSCPKKTNQLWGIYFIYTFSQANKSSIENAATIEEFENATRRAKELIGKDGRGHRKGLRRLWAYSRDGRSRLSYGDINGNLSQTKTKVSRTAQRIASRLAGREISPEVETVTEDQNLSSTKEEAHENAPKYAKRIVNRLRRLKGTLLGNSIGKLLWNKKPANLIGQKVQNAKDLATLAQIYRKLLFETFRIFFFNDDGEIVHQIGITSKMSSMTGLFPSRHTS